MTAKHFEAALSGFRVFAQCLCEKLSVSVVSLCFDIFTTEAPSPHGDTEKNKMAHCASACQPSLFIRY